MHYKQLHAITYNYIQLHTLIAFQQHSESLPSFLDLEQPRTALITLIDQMLRCLDVHFVNNLCHGQKILNVAKLGSLFPSVHQPMHFVDRAYMLLSSSSLRPVFESLEGFPALPQEFLGFTVHFMNLFNALCILPVQLVECELGVYDGNNISRWIFHHIIISCTSVPGLNLFLKKVVEDEG